MAVNQERVGRDVLEDEEGTYDPLLDDLDLETLMEDVGCGAGKEEEDPAHETQGNVATWKKPGNPGVVHDGNCSRHEPSAFVTTGAITATLNTNDQQPGLSRDTMYSTPIEPDEDSENRDQERTTQDGRMDIPSVDDDVIPAGQGPPKEKLQTLLECKAHLRQVLLRAEHHRVFVDKCKMGNIIPKGSRLNREIHFNLQFYITDFLHPTP